MGDPLHRVRTEHFDAVFDLVITRYAGVPAMTRVLEMAHARGELGSLLVELAPPSADED
ncbi:hypothetical protein [Streptomyces sp. 35G-GA-8]|uniref:hypothetical protein n=1 Tax=Streptomyces sp. 35G-GA-8 TaxID=2939434 RepID=UPI00201E96C6|nr:hypothetical protein [Streptomyces sp. 35G-GA-8]MCL7381543.1 hypothetical protein [Streptomyces sp. 35G-GA-8]